MIKKNRFRPLWLKTTFLFFGLILISSFLIISITLGFMRIRFTNDANNMDRQVAKILAFRVKQVLSKEHLIQSQLMLEVCTPQICRENKMHPKILSLRNEFYDSEIEDFLPVLINNYPHLFNYRKMPHNDNFDLKPIIIYFSKAGEVLYKNSLCENIKKMKRKSVEIIIDGECRGRISVSSAINRTLNGRTTKIFNSLLLSVLLSSFISLILSIFAAIFLIRRITKPLTALKEGTSRIAKGDFNLEVAISGNDELTQLSLSFNLMAKKLHQLDSSRKQMLVDISHELRTPVALLRARIEMINLGRYKADKENLFKMEKDIENLSDLINSVHKLMVFDSSDSNQENESVDLISVINSISDEFKTITETKNIELIKNSSTDFSTINGSLYECKSALKNLVSNSINYCNNGDSIEIKLSKKVEKNVKYQ